ncbi:MAG: SRPBCC family protein [Acidimicrobiales bacterium]
MTNNHASVREEVRIEPPAAQVGELVGDPTRVHEWCPGIVSCRVDGDVRVITARSGLNIHERIVTHDPLLRRFQYEIDPPIVRAHLGTLDVIELDEASRLVVSSTDAEPATVALTIGGPAGAGLHRLGSLLEAA